MGEKKYKTEWSFSFDNIAKRIEEGVSNVFGDDSSAEAQDIKFASFSEALDGREKGTVKITHDVGRLEVGALVASDNLIEADVNYIGEVEFKVEEDKSVILRQVEAEAIRRGIVKLKKRNNDLRWDIRLSPEVPLNLDIESGVGSAELNLAGLRLSRLNVESGVSKVLAYLPASDSHYHVNIESGVSSVELHLLHNTNVSINIAGGVGSVKVIVPEQAALHVKAEVGVGRLNMPDYLQRQRKSSHLIGESGVWQSPDYENAAHQIQVKYGGGAARFQIETATTLV